MAIAALKARHCKTALLQVDLVWTQPCSVSASCSFAALANFIGQPPNMRFRDRIIKAALPRMYREIADTPLLSQALPLETLDCQSCLSGRGSLTDKFSIACLLFHSLQVASQMVQTVV